MQWPVGSMGTCGWSAAESSATFGESGKKWEQALPRLAKVTSQTRAALSQQVIGLPTRMDIIDVHPGQPGPQKQLQGCHRE